MEKGEQYVLFLSPPVHIAQWAHMGRFLSLRPSVCHMIKIHILESIIDRSLKLYHSTCPSVPVTDYTLRTIHVTKWAWYFSFDR